MKGISSLLIGRFDCSSFGFTTFNRKALNMNIYGGCYIEVCGYEF